MTGETFKATVLAVGNAGTAFVFDYGFVDLAGGSFHFDTTTAAADFQTLVEAKFTPCLPVSVAIVKYRFACVGGTSVGEIGFKDVAPPVTGTNGGNFKIPPEICISLKRSTGRSSRRDRGRIFFGPVSDDYQDATYPDVVASTVDLAALRDTLKATLTTQGHDLTPVILASDGSYNGNTIQHVGIGPVMVHHKSRRLKTLT